MSQQVSARRPNERPPTRAEKRKAWKEAAARAAAARRRRRTIGGSVGSLAVVALLVTLVVVVVRKAGDDETGSARGDGTQATADATPEAQGFPPLPAGADPALRTKPAATKGTGELTSLVVTPLINGTGPATAAGQQITVNYVGVSYRTGEEFDSSWKRQQTFDFQLGAGRVIKGWDQGLVGVPVGSRVQLDIPADLAYGDDAGASPSGPLRFIVDVLAAA